MGFKPTNKVPKSINYKRYIDGVEIKPSMFVGKNGKGVIGGALNGDIVLDNDGNAVPFGRVQHTEIAIANK
jgi:hypothetical protein